MNEVELFNPDYMAIPVGSLVPNSKPEFDIFIKYGSEFVLFAGNNAVVKSDALDRLSSCDLEVLYVHRNNADRFEQYSNENMRIDKNKDNSILEQKSKVLYASAKDVMNRLFCGEITHVDIVHTKVVAMDLVRQITADKKAFLSLVRVSSHDYYTYTHSINVCIYSVAIGGQLELGKSEMKILAEGALLHDIGKSKIPSSIINKHGKLSEDEFRAIKLHPIYGAEILMRNGENNQAILNIISQHHEKLNSRGYPLKLSRYEISKMSQIVTIADVFDALTTKRAYKDAMTTFEAFSLMRTSMREELNMEILDKFISNFRF